MRTIVQLSDLHFGTTIAATLEPLVALLARLAPDLVIVSGDFTQRARVSEFEAARAYVQRLPAPQLLIPGNHDVPLYDVMRRFLSPLGHYRRYITPDLSPCFVDDEIAVFGINTARSFTFKGGTIDDAQVNATVTQLARLPSHVARLVVTHHPFSIPGGLSGVNVVRGATRALQAFAPHKVDMYLSGHLHLVHYASASAYVPGYEAPLLVAGTAVSTRARGEANSFYVLRVGRGAIECDTYRWDAAGGEFRVVEATGFGRVSGG